MIGPLPFIGGKNRLAKTIIQMLPEHIAYIEPFAGGAQVLFHKAPSNVEVINDLDTDIVNFFRVCQWHYEELVRYLRYCLMSRKLHDLHAQTDPATLTDVQRAARFFYLQKTSWGGLLLKHDYHFHVTQRPNYDPGRVPEIIERVHQRLQRVQIECAPYGDILEKYDRASSCFFVDPPYWERRYYSHNFTPDDFQVLAQRLGALKGTFLLTIDDRPEIRELFKAFTITPVTLSYSAQPKAGNRYRELIITNYDPAALTVPAERYESTLANQE